MISSVDADAQLEAALASIREGMDPFQDMLASAGYLQVPHQPALQLRQAPAPVVCNWFINKALI